MHCLFRSCICSISYALFVSTTSLPFSREDYSKSVGSTSLNSKRRVSASAPMQYAGTFGRWYTNIIIGGQELTLEVDTGSADLWVYGPKVANSPGKHKIYDETRSSIAITGGQFNLTYDNGNYISGSVVEDTVAFGSVSIPNVAIGIASDVENGTYLDGMIGMGFQNNFKPKGLASFIDAAKPHLDMPVFALDLGNVSDATMTLGAIDTSRYSGDLTTLQGVQCGQSWCIDKVTFSVNDIPLNFTQTRLVVDTGGSTTMAVDPTIARRYYHQIEDSRDNSGLGSEWTVPCDAELPDLTVYVGKESFAIPGRLFQSGKISPSTSKCIGNLQGIQSSTGVGNLADPFFLSQYVVFRIDDSTISVAPFAHMAN